MSKAGHKETSDEPFGSNMDSLPALQRFSDNLSGYSIVLECLTGT
jgi:hypothetical protein